MIVLNHHNVRSRAAMALRRGAAVAILAGAALVGGQGPGFAQSTSWEEGCAMRIVTPGSGDALRVYNCARQKECQQMANARGGTMMGMGCFGVEPQAQAPAARQAGRTRPAQQQ